MIWVDGYKWPPELHGTGSEDYLNQAWQLVLSLCASSLLCHFKVPKGFSIVLLGEVVLTKGKLSLCTA